MPNYAAARGQMKKYGRRKGFFNAWKEEDQRVNQRVQQLADDKAKMQMEQSKSQLVETLRSAKAEQNKFKELQTHDYVDAEGNYTPKWFNKMALEDAIAKGIKIPSDPAKQQEYIEKYKAMNPQKFVRHYGDINQYTREHNLTVEKATKERMNASGHSAFTGLLIDGVGATVDKYKEMFFPPEETKAAQPVESTPTIDTYAAVREEPEGLSSVTTGQDQATTGPWFSQKPKAEVKVVDGVLYRVGDTKETTIALTDPKENKVSYKHMPNAVDLEGVPQANIHVIDDGERSGTYEKVGENKFVERFDIVSPASTEYAAANRTKKLTKLDNTQIERKDRQIRVARLASNLAKHEYTSDPVSLISRILSVVSDVGGAAVGLTGDTEHDVNAMYEYLQNRSSDELYEKIGYLDTQAVIKGDKEAAKTFLQFAAADMFNEGGKISVKSYEAAQDATSTWFEGTDKERGKLSSLATSAAEEAVRVSRDHLRRIKDDKANPLWDQYPQAKILINRGFNVVNDKYAGRKVISKLKKMEKDNPSKFNAVTRHMQERLGTADLRIFENPLIFDKAEGELKAIYYKENDKGDIVFGWNLL